MRDMKTKTMFGRLLPVAAAALASLLALTAQAAAPGITGGAASAAAVTFNLSAAPAYISQPDGATIYSWGYGCTSGATPAPGNLPATIDAAPCPNMQIPGPTLIVTQGQTVTVTLTNNLPKPTAGNTSILFPGFQVCAATLQSDGTCTGPATGTPGLLAAEAPNSSCDPSSNTGCNTVTYMFKATTPGTHAYYSGTQGDLQIEMGLYGAIVVLPNTSVNTGGCTSFNTGQTLPSGQTDYRLATAAYDHEKACYDREYLFQFSEMDPKIHSAAEAIAKCNPAQPGVVCPINMNTVETEPYTPVYFMINGRSMPDNMDPNYTYQYPHQPYNGNPHMHPGELTLLRIIGHGRWQHPFHEHGNHVRVLARDGNLLLAQGAPTKLAGPLLFTTTTTPGLAMDGIFQWTGKGLNWDVYAHSVTGAGSVYNMTKPDPQNPNPYLDALYTKYNGKAVVCTPDLNGYYTTASGALADAPNYHEWCGDHNKALESKPFGAVASGGPVTLPDPGIVTNGAWYGGSPYLGPDAMIRATGSTPIPPSGTVANSPTDEAGFAYMWHSHNEREITTNNIFPGGMLMMMLVDPAVFAIDESK